MKFVEGGIQTVGIVIFFYLKNNTAEVISGESYGESDYEFPARKDG